MTTSMTARNTDRPARDATGWLALAASPTFALMAWIAATGAPGNAICATAPGLLPIDGMAWMYLLMSLFHVSPWLKLASTRPRHLTQATTRPEGD